MSDKRIRIVLIVLLLLVVSLLGGVTPQPESPRQIHTVSVLGKYLAAFVHRDQQAFFDDSTPAGPTTLTITSDSPLLAGYSSDNVYNSSTMCRTITPTYSAAMTATWLDSTGHERTHDLSGFALHICPLPDNSLTSPASASGLLLLQPVHYNVSINNVKPIPALDTVIVEGLTNSQATGNCKTFTVPDGYTGKSPQLTYFDADGATEYYIWPGDTVTICRA